MSEAQPRRFNPFSMATWIAWFGAAIMAVLTLAGFAYSTFETRDSANFHQQAMEKQIEIKDQSFDKRLDRIENKIDLLIDQRRK
jgi:hypothetical protein